MGRAGPRRRKAAGVSDQRTVLARASSLSCISTARSSARSTRLGGRVRIRV